MTSHSPWGGRGGFTLIELLVGLTISTFIMGSAAAVFVLMLGHWDRGQREQRLQQVAQTTSDMIERYLRCAAPPGRNFGTFTGEDLSSEEVDGHRLTFYSTAEGRFPRSAPRTDVSEVEFCYDPENDGMMSVRIDSTPDEDYTMGGLRVQLSPMIQGFRVMYYTGFEWVSEWYENTLPKAVEFHLIIGDPAEVDAEGNPVTREYSRLVWLPMGKERPPEETGDVDSSQGGGGTNQGGFGGGDMGGER